MEPLDEESQLLLEGFTQTKETHYHVAFLFQFEGTPFFPNHDRFWYVCAKYKVTQFYTAPTAIRALTKFGDDLVKL